ncbi:putative lipoate-protein ligase A [Escovopsis weberi]|uniref:Putative lipoate-protein ligase A n=1 Tax=Escovopsis weberi TaxID=150374 RepID=A0A0M8N4X4_ESCWE|nr:putative lipoate-protein ligase A [Escovopsis weberi]
MLLPPTRPGLRLVPKLRRHVSSSLSQTSNFSIDAASHPSNKVQVYISQSSDPFLNLSVEHCLLQVTPPDSTVLTLYTNAPSIIFGRNQNPWLEVNLSRLAQIRSSPRSIRWKDGPVQLVRRRSGGGAVFHDAGNVNFSVICPPGAFDRNKHAEMVVRALQNLGRPNTRVNGRHDIVMDVADEGKESPGSELSTFKISGSAYKLTRLRSLHHGTCLLRSPNLSNISGLLRSPGEGFIKALGVDSVRSPVRNVGVENADFEAAIVEEFGNLYGQFDVQQGFDHAALGYESIARGYEELRSKNWIYGQTPRFSFGTHPTDDDPRPRPDLPFDFDILFKAKHGILEDFAIHKIGSSKTDASLLKDRSLHEVRDWTNALAEVGLSGGDASQVGGWMNQILGTDFTRL